MQPGFHKIYSRKEYRPVDRHSGVQLGNSKTARFGALATASLIFLNATFAPGQNSQFVFDHSGNLTAQTAEIGDPPQILSQPHDQTAAPGALTSFLVVAADTYNLTYQWRLNGADISGATSDSLLLTNVSVANVGQYSVVLINNSGSVTSAPAALMLDGDRDGLPDSWEQTYFGGLSQNPTGDFDGDGVSNLDEFLDGTDPTDSASLMFRLTLLSDGGQVQATPGSLKYTNGEIVTLTALAISPEIFHGWTGDIIARTNQLSLIMTNNKTLFAHFQPAVLTWAASSGSWHGPTNWSPTFVPTAVDEVRITSGGTVTINEPAECEDFVFSNGTLTGSGLLEIHSNAFWTGGTMSGSGRTVIPEGATLNLANGGAVGLNNRTVENGGTVMWTGGNININTAVITNRAGALVEVRGTGGLAYNGGLSRLDNAGTLRKTINTGTTTIGGNIALNNYSSVEIQTGTLDLFGGGLNTGTMDVPAGTLLDLSSGTFTSSAASSIAGGGQLMMSGATANLAGLVNVSSNQVISSGTANLTGNYYCTNNVLTLSGGTANFNGTGLVTPTALTLNGGTLSGNQTVTVLGVMNWTGGTMSGSGRTVIPEGATLNLANGGAVGLNNRTVENGGTVMWTGGNININTAVITNRAGALVEVRGTGGLAYNGGLSRLDNAGTLRKTINTGTTTIGGNIALNNYSSVEIQTGTLDLFGGGLNTGTMDVPAGTLLDLSSGTFTSSAASSIAGGGQLMMSGATANLAGLVNVSSNQVISSGTANLTGNYYCTNNVLTLSGGTANFNGTGLVTPTALTLNGGTLSGNQTVTVLGVMNWTGGTMSGSGRTVIPEGATLNLANGGAVGLNNRTVENGGTVMWTGGNININTAVITNRAGALVEVRGTGGLAYNGGLSRLDNAGTLRKTINTGTTTIGGNIALNNYSSVEIQTGTLDLFGGGLNTGTMDVPAGTLLDLSSGTFTSSAASSIAGGGQLMMSGATANLAGLVNVSSNQVISSGTANLTGNYYCTNNVLTLSGGTANFNGTGLVTPTALTLNGGTLSGNQTVTVLGVMNWTGGTMSGSGRTVIPEGATLNLANGGAVGLNNRTVENGGTVMWTGGNININTAVITNRAGALVEVRGTGGLAYNGGLSRLDNAGTLRKTINTGTTTIGGNIALNNYSSVEIQTGILAASGGFASTTNSLLSCAIGGTAVGAGYGRLQVSGAVTLNGALSVSLVNGFVPTTNDTFTVLTAGTRNGTFANFYYPSNDVTMQLNNTANSVVVQVTAVADPKPVLLQPEIIGPDLKLTWTAISNRTYQLEFNPDLNPSNWTALPGEVTAVSNTASKPDAFTTSNRFYRVRVLP